MSIEADIKRQIQHAYKPIAFPEARSLSDLFERWEIIRELRGYKSRTAHEWVTEETSYKGKRPRHFKGLDVLSTFCGIMAADHSLDVWPLPATLAHITEHMLHMDRDTKNFSIVVREGGASLVTCNYSLISGGTWLAIIPTASLPAELWEPAS